MNSADSTSRQHQRRRTRPSPGARERFLPPPRGGWSGKRQTKTRMNQNTRTSAGARPERTEWIEQARPVPRRGCERIARQPADDRGDETPGGRSGSRCRSRSCGDQQSPDSTPISGEQEGELAGERRADPHQAGAAAVDHWRARPAVTKSARSDDQPRPAATTTVGPAHRRAGRPEDQSSWRWQLG